MFAQKTKMIARHNVVKSAIVIAGFISWIVGSRIVGEDGPWKFAPGYIIGAISFVIVACFLPDVRPTTFLSRRSSLGLASLLAWLASNQVYAHGPSSHNGDFWTNFLIVGIPLIIAFGLYWLSLLLMRGLRTFSWVVAQGESGPRE